MKIYAVYGTNENGRNIGIDSYWLHYENAIARFEKIWPYVRKPDKDEINFHVKKIETKD